MLSIWFFMFVCCVVKCDYIGNNYINMDTPEMDIPKHHNTPFKVYWNVPTKQCKSKKIPFDNLEKFGIIQNVNDTFEGDRVTILYHPGEFPGILNDKTSNGGVPHLGNLELHLLALREHLNKLIPNTNFSGIGIIDFEYWRPIFRQQFGNLKPFYCLSLKIEEKLHPDWPMSWRKMEATKRFEDAARVFMQTSLSVAKQMRPRAVWGYYAYPYCFNEDQACSKSIKEENDRTYWLWAESTALYPSLYVNSNTKNLRSLVRERVLEANRLKKNGSLVLPYFWFRYRDGGFLKEEDVIAVFTALQETNASGIVIWGGSRDVNEPGKCQDLYKYVETTLGPIVKKYLQIINKVSNKTMEVDNDHEKKILDDTLNKVQTKIDLKFLLFPQKNDSTNIMHNVLSIKNYYKTNDTKVETDIDLKIMLLPQTVYPETISHNVQQEHFKKEYYNTDDNKLEQETDLQFVMLPQSSDTEKVSYNVQQVNTSYSNIDNNGTKLNTSNKFATENIKYSSKSKQTVGNIETLTNDTVESYSNKNNNRTVIKNTTRILTDKKENFIDNDEKDNSFAVNLTDLLISSENFNDNETIIKNYLTTSTDRTDNSINIDKYDDLFTVNLTQSIPLKNEEKTVFNNTRTLTNNFTENFVDDKYYTYKYDTENNKLEPETDLQFVILPQTSDTERVLYNVQQDQVNTSFSNIVNNETKLNANTNLTLSIPLKNEHETVINNNTRTLTDITENFINYDQNNNSSTNTSSEHETPSLNINDDKTTIAN